MKHRSYKPLSLLASLAVIGTLLGGAAAADAATRTIKVAIPMVNAHAVELHWQRVSHATGYKVLYDTSRNLSSPQRTPAVKATHAAVTRLQTGQRYYLRVFALRHGHRIAQSNLVVVRPHAQATPPQPDPSTTSPGVHATLAGALANVAGGTAARLQAGTYTFDNFARGENGTAGYDVPAGVGKIQGAGVDKTVIEMTAHSSTKAAKVPTAFGTTNQLSLLVTHGTAVSDLTLQGTMQDHLYNGLRVHRANNTRVTNVKVAAMPGSKNYPPGETFGINDYRTNGSVYTGLEIDGAGVGAAGFGGNNSENISISNAYFHDNPYSAGITFWQSSNITLTDVRSVNNHGAFNFERDAGTINIVRPMWSGIGNRHAFSFNSDQASARVNIYDPVLPAGASKIYILVAKSYLGVANRQQRSDIHVYVKGKDVTSSLVVFAG